MKIFIVHEAESTEDALQLLESYRVDLVIVDMRLPGMDGTTFINNVSAKWPDLKFIVYTVSPEYGIPAELARVPFVSNSVFFKPLPFCEVMIDEIRRMLE
ncbi:response regulator [Desulfovibrio sp. JC022]|uniref:response regulator n=1 Tax=Desulfovibrio sp. JC022 TaxID=2593642 RepID=UPI001EF28557|nr:response regulator [Desulfovibrio sp. JC022]